MTVTTDHLTELNPLTGEPVGEVRANTPEQVRTAVERAREAQQAWAQLPYRQRARIVIRAHDLILDRRDEIIALIQAETGKSRRDAFVEIFAVASEMRHYAYDGWRHIRPRR
ncbi:MAG: aldehyde dehydrogenase family protein, partial [Anaerolineae bacterium]